jgi:predicted MPP superfamily phosphohydrolase
VSRGCLTVGIVAALVGVALAAVGYRNATAAPMVRRLLLTVPNYPANVPPVRIALFSDLHVHGPDMPPRRLAKIVDQINALHPDIDIAAGDFEGNTWIGRDYPLAVAVAPLRRLKTRLGVYAVLGNNDFESGEDVSTDVLEAAGIHVISNDAVRVGPLALGGLKGRLYSHSKMLKVQRKIYDAMQRTPGVKVLISHRPDEFAAAPPWVSLVLAGHTHCGQIVLPLIGPLVTGSDFGRKYLCGLVRDGSKLLVVTAGLGTSHLPIRFGAPPDLWLITIRGPRP